MSRFITYENLKMFKQFKKQKWDLSELISGPIEEFFKKIELKTKNFEKFRKLLNPKIKPELFLKILKENEEICKMLARLSGYAELLFFSNTQNKEAIKLKTQVEQFSADIENRILFFSLFWKKLQEKEARRILKRAFQYRYFLKNLRKFRKYTLKESEEKIINLKDVSGESALKTLYFMLVNKFLFELELKGEKKYFTRNQLAEFFRSPDKELRKKAYIAFYTPFKHNKELITEIYRAIVLDWKNENIKLRGFKDAISVRNLLNDLSDKTVENLFSVCENNVDVFQKYFKIKAKAMGIKKLTRYDIYAPIGKQKKMHYNETMQIVFEAFKEFCPCFYRHALKLVKKKHIDSEIRKGKVAGAFNYPVVPEVLPYVLINPSKTFYSALEIAHELGHAIHSIFSSKNSFFNYHAPLPIAEIASIFCEMLVYDKMFEKEQKEFKKHLIFHQIDDFYATIQRQVFFSIFEKDVHANIQKLSSEEIALLYKKNLKKQFGNSIFLPEDFKWEWLTISHFYESPFYCYSYAFANLLVLSLYERYKREGKDFLSSYLNLLKAGSSKEPEKLLQEHDFNIRSKNFWQNGFKFIKEIIKKAKNVS